MFFKKYEKKKQEKRSCDVENGMRMNQHCGVNSSKTKITKKFRKKLKNI